MAGLLNVDCDTVLGVRSLKNEEETPTLTYEQDEEFLTNDHFMKLTEVGAGAGEGTDQMSH